MKKEKQTKDCSKCISNVFDKGVNKCLYIGEDNEPCVNHNKFELDPKLINKENK